MYTENEELQAVHEDWGSGKGWGLRNIQGSDRERAKATLVFEVYFEGI